ncbi:complex I intermediate-associated protein 30 (CIA30) [Nonlabens xylanidelens]|uniref:Complex I intermediate-associated protein 30 (CIA30) n=1 Tax=Nonlabens xylanidelens TaxID=191564 RepID=A0A2S6IDX4_9FLAO|nr:CIA30 family protein [Nonlabens xylanidelens]PPK92383.1 complex I intermediate-associated protein 30 (CIA30) [Nonlabens xylanidelens]
MMVNNVLFDFDSKSDLENWSVLNDTVMGGTSKSSFELNEEGHAVFSGKVNLKNDGGFASVKYDCPDTKLGDTSIAVLRIKGDGKNYQLRFKETESDYHSYIITFPTTGEWETVELEVDEMIPSYRGRQLNMENFHHTMIDELTFFIGNGEEETFELLIDKIEFK